MSPAGHEAGFSLQKTTQADRPIHAKLQSTHAKKMSNPMQNHSEETRQAREKRLSRENKQTHERDQVREENGESQTGDAGGKSGERASEGLGALSGLDFSTPRSAARAYRAFGADPVPLIEGEIAEGRQSKVWNEADGVGILFRSELWQGLCVSSIKHGKEVRSAIQRLRMEDSAWVARSDEAALIYFQTDASMEIMRAHAAVWTASRQPRFRHAGDMEPIRPVGNRTTILPLPPTADPERGRWRFLNEKTPSTPPPYRMIKVSAETRPKLRKNWGESKAISNAGMRRNRRRQMRQRTFQSSQSDLPDDDLPFPTDDNLPF
jgi:hypothetical protein